MYIQYTMDQLTLPMDLAEDIPDNHLVRVVNAAVDRLSDKIFADAYPGGGRDSYHPKMLTKVIIYAYAQRIYSSRQIAKSAKISCSCGSQGASDRTSARSTAFVPSA
ncbi:transposase [Paenibacillus anseongense]|nr:MULTISPECIES: transposase [Paenibacillus]MCY9661992.1 transposase [Paenibacillus anseongense]